MKQKLLYIAIIATLVAGCRPKGDVYFDPNDPINMQYATYADQFDAIWRGMNTHYVFWSEDSTNWDAVYKDFLPRFQELDTAYVANGATPDSATFANLYTEMTATLRDHHLTMQVRDVHTKAPYAFCPGMVEVKQRDYAVGQDYSFESIQTALDGFVSSGLLSSGTWGEMNEQHNFFGVRNVDSKKIAYLWLSNFQLTESLAKEPASESDSLYIQNIRDWMNLCLNDSSLLGIILDTRCNTGGNVGDLDLVVAPFISKPLRYADVRYKEGSGRYEYTDWIPAIIDTVAPEDRRDLEAENIPYVVISNAMSISMGEISAAAIKQLPTGCMIGERTFGAHGQIMPYPALLHDGSFGDRNGLHYVYTSSMQTRFTGEEVLEGIGVEPDKSILQVESGYLGAMEKAIDYIKAY